jgi:hypothetical protein
MVFTTATTTGLGYAAPRVDSSGINYFDNSGRRTGYQNYEKR